MASCKDCIHYNLCRSISRIQLGWRGNSVHYVENVEEICKDFKDRARFVELTDIGDYDAVTTIDEAIDHCYQIATSTDETVCAECKAEHMRLCDWLGDLKRRIVAEQALKEREENETTGYCRRDSKSGTMGIISRYRSF